MPGMHLQRLVASKLFQIFYFVTVLILAASCHPRYSERVAPVAKNGTIDLKNWDFEKDGPIRLNGEWELFWQQQLDQKSLNNTNQAAASHLRRDGLYELPREKGWMDHPLSSGRELAHLGFGTFSLKLLMPNQEGKPSQNPDFAMGLARAFTSYSLQAFDANGNPLGAAIKRGKAGPNRAETVPQNVIGMVPFSTAKQIHLVWQVSNFHYFIGGPVVAPLIGTYIQVHDQHLAKFFKDAFIAGLLIIIGLYHLIIYALYRRESAPLWFGLFCFQIAGYSLVVDGYVNSQFDGVFAWTLILRFYYGLFLYPTVSTFLLFLKHAFPGMVFKKSARMIVWTGFLTGLVSVMTPLDWILQRYLHYFFLLMVSLGIFYVIAVMSRAINSPQRKQAFVLSAGFALFSLALTHDVLGNIGMIPFYFNWTSTGLSLFILFQAIVISMNNRQVHNDKYLAQERTAEELEKKVSERTVELAAKSDQQKELLHVLCHDLSNPFTNIRAVLEFSEVNVSFFEEMKEALVISAENGLELINLIKEISALEEGMVQIELDHFNLGHLINKSLSILNHRIEEKGISINLNVDNTLLAQVERISFVNSVLNNILSNAIKFSAPHALITIDAYTSDWGAVVEISDFGIGMPAKILDNLYDMTKKTNRAGTQGETGTGFGMPLVKKLVERYGGSLQIVSKNQPDFPNDHGTTVTIYLQTN